jgi:phage gp45-like
MGEVRAIIKPTDKESVSKKFNEYTVSVVQYENGMFARRLYYNCLLMNTIAGGGDKVYWTLRPSSKTSGEGNTATVADGSRVLVLCIEGSASRAYIIGGIRDERSEPDDPKLGHHFNWEFNGVNFRVNDDGSWSIVNKGKTTNLGGVAPSADKSGIGTTIKTEANGNIIINTPDNNQSIVIDNTNNSITINADSHITVNGNRIDIGKDANEPQVLGQQLVQLLQDLITAITSMSMFSFGTPTGPITSPPINSPQFLAIAARLETLLSHQSFVKRG